MTYFTSETATVIAVNDTKRGDVRLNASINLLMNMCRENNIASEERRENFRSSSFLRPLDRRFLVPEVVFLGGDRK